MKSNALIIEDDPDTAHLLGMLLTRNSFRFELASTLADGISRADSHPFPEIILLDLTLPDSSPAETVRRLPELMRNSPVLVLSHCDDPDLKSRIEAVGSHYARKEMDRVGGERIFSAMVTAIQAWKHTTNSEKKKTSRIDLNLLEMRAIFSKNVAA